MLWPISKFYTIFIPFHSTFMQFPDGFIQSKNTKNEKKNWDLLNITFNSVYYIIISF